MHPFKHYLPMAKKRKHERRDEERDGEGKAASDAAPERVFASPFKDLKKMLAARNPLPAQIKPKPPPPPLPAIEKPVQPVAETLDDESVLRHALEGVRPLHQNGNARSRIPLDPPTSHTIVDEDAEVIARLSDLVSGQAPFDITESDEYVEGYRVGLDPRLVSQLRRGEFAVQAHFDMHGMIQGAAKEALKEFIIASVCKGLRTVLVVHGRGLRSPGGHSVLKHASAGWLSHGAIGGHVLAFTTARPTDGGAGATYVLLKREKSRAPFDILQGAKRR
jgi:DNA-nicking Smr family endonuclease